MLFQSRNCISNNCTTGGLSCREDEKFVDYINRVETRFGEVCSLYLPTLTMKDIKYLQPEDLINIVPSNMFEHKLFMTILVRRYLCRPDDSKQCDEDNTSKDSR
jgi:hypothetical protein